MGSGPVLLKNCIFVAFPVGVRAPCPPPPPSGSAHDKTASISKLNCVHIEPHWVMVLHVETSPEDKY